MLTNRQQKQRSGNQQEQIGENCSRSVPEDTEQHQRGGNRENERFAVMRHRRLELVQQSIVAVKRLHGSMLVVRRLNALVKRGQRHAHPVTVKPNSEDVADEHNKGHRRHETGEPKPEVGGNVLLPENGRRL